jgi:hypothetical protein
MENKLTKWQNSNAKELLRKDILDGKVVDSMMSKEVLAMRPENEPYRKNFGTNLRNLQKRSGRTKPMPIQTVLHLPMTVAFFRRRPTLPRATHDGTDLMPNDS